MKLLLYCTKAKPYLTMTTDFVSYTHFDCYDMDFGCLNGKIVGECDFEVERIHSKNIVDFEKGSCLDRISMFKYLKPNVIWTMKFNEILNTFGYLTLGYAIHIKNLHIFNEPRKLGNYYSQNQVDFIVETELWRLKSGIKKAPQNMCYAYKYNWSENKLDKYILISIRPQWLCKILNGEKTIEVRKKVLKEMINND